MDWLETFKHKRQERLAKDQARYAALVVRPTLKPAEVDELSALADTLGKNAESVGADVAIIGELRAHEAVVAELDVRHAAMQDARTKAADHADETARLVAEAEAALARLKSERADVQRGLDWARTRATESHDAAVLADDRASEIRHTHWTLLGLTERPARTTRRYRFGLTDEGAKTGVYSVATLPEAEPARTDGHVPEWSGVAE